ncbi:MAG TPA: response regulator, partial [Kofleriaceae bacterium]|nr:response regulator [Kofleriaceae bacterium]
MSVPLNDERGSQTGTTIGVVWICDDSRTQVALTEHVLGPIYAYEQFADGPSMLERLAAATTLPDVILCDWVMPV